MSIGSLACVSSSETIRMFRDRPTQASIGHRPEFCTRNRSGVSSPTTTIAGITRERVRLSRICESTRRPCSERVAHPELHIAMDASANAATDRAAIDFCTTRSPEITIPRISVLISLDAAPLLVSSVSAQRRRALSARNSLTQPGRAGGLAVEQIRPDRRTRHRVLERGVRHAEDDS